MPVLDFLYKTVPGRLILKPLTSRGVSKLSGRLMDTGISKILIKPFVKNAGIDVSEYDLSNVKSFNTFFYRPVLPGRRPVCEDPNVLAAPCDGLLTAIPIRDDTVLHVKQSEFSITELLRSRKLAEKYKDGMCLVFRLCVDNYHRYAYVDSGVKSENTFIKGKLHTVNPVALDHVPVFHENCREYTVIDGDNIGRHVMMEVGAMLVGKIVNHHGAGRVKRGAEKGFFMFGGSTVVLLTKKDIVPDNDILFNTRKGIETLVKLGEQIGHKKN